MALLYPAGTRTQQEAEKEEEEGAAGSECVSVATERDAERASGRIEEEV